MVLGQHSLQDPSRTPADRYRLYAYTHVPSRHAERDEDVLGRSARSPERLERENPSLVGGDLGGGSAEVDQQLAFRPVPERSRCRTPLRGPYVASVSVHAGPGMQGVCGAGAARAVRADASGLRPRRRPR